MSTGGEELNEKTLEMVNTKDIKHIKITSIGIMNLFNKLEIDIEFKNKAHKHLIGINFNINIVKEWLDRNNLYEKAIMYQF